MKKQHYEMLAGEEAIVALALTKFNKGRFPEATWEVVPHEGRAGVSVYGNANWDKNPEWDATGNSLMSAYLEGLYDASK